MVCASCSNNKNDTADFRFNLQKGKTYEYNMDYDMEQNMQDQEINTNLKGNYTLDVTADDGNIKTLKTTYQRIAMNVAMPGRTMSIDSDKADTASKGEINDPGQLMNAMFSALKGKSFMMKVDKEGKVLEVTGLNELAQAMVSSMNLKPEMRSMAQQAFSQQFNEQSVKDMFSQSFNIFPNKPVKAGDTWEKSFSGSATLPIQMTTNYTVKSIDGDFVILDSRSNLNFGDDNKMSGTQSGTMKVNAKTGLVEDGTFEQKVTGNMSMSTKGRITGKEKN
jgi:hypothetical protein